MINYNSMNIYKQSRLTSGIHKLIFNAFRSMMKNY